MQFLLEFNLGTGSSSFIADNEQSNSLRCKKAKLSLFSLTEFLNSYSRSHVYFHPSL